MIFDFRVRLGRGEGAVDQLLATMDAGGIGRAAVTAGGVVGLERLSEQIVYGGHTDGEPDNDRVLAACAAAGGRLMPVYFANPRCGTPAYRTAAAQYRGLELSPAVHGVGLTDARTSALVEVAAEVGHSVYTVTLGRPGSRTTDLVELARRHPSVTFILGHCGFIGIDAHAVRMIAPQPNIVVETSGCFTAVARAALTHLGAERVLFGTEFPLQHPSVELAKYASLALPATTWRQIAWHNAMRILGEDAT